MVEIRSKPAGYRITRWSGGVASTEEVAGQGLLFETEGASLVGMTLADLNLVYADLDGADLRDADFTHSNLDAASFRGAILARTRFERSSLAFADFSHATLCETDFSSANLLWADFSACDMSSAIFTGAHMDFAFYDEETVWPEGLSPEDIRAHRRQDVPREWPGICDDGLE